MFVFQLDFGKLFNFGGGDGGGSTKSLRSEPEPEKEFTYKVPEERKEGRPHELGWLERLETPKEDRVRLGKVPAGKIIMED